MIFMIKPLQNWGYILVTSLKETLELPNFGHMTTYTIKFESRGKILVVMPWTEIMTS